MTDWSRTETVTGRYQGHLVEVTVYTLDRRRVIGSFPSHAQMRAAVRAYRSRSKR